MQVSFFLLIRTVSDLLNYDRIEQGNLQLQLRLISGWQLVEKVTHEFGLACASKTIDLDLSFAVPQESIDAEKSSDRLPDFVQKLVVIGDSVRLTQTLRNLLSNAVKFTKEGGSICVTAAYNPTPESCQTENVQLSKTQYVSAIYKGLMQIDVRDTGVGLSPDQISQLFRDGSQIDPNGLQSGGGSGLGLYIAKGIVDQHNGSLSVSSDGVGHGCTFSVSLPIWDVEDSAKFEAQDVGNTATDAKQKGEDSSSVVGLGSLRLLVVEDVKSNRKLLCRLLRNKGHACDEAENGLIAVEKVKSAVASGTPYHSVLMDFEMRTNCSKMCFYLHGFLSQVYSTFFSFTDSC
jgi:hypothetical protein